MQSVLNCDNRAPLANDCQYRLWSKGGKVKASAITNQKSRDQLLKGSYQLRSIDLKSPNAWVVQLQFRDGILVGRPGDLHSRYARFAR